jgi:hypothetical protein
MIGSTKSYCEYIMSIVSVRLAHDGNQWQSLVKTSMRSEIP